MNLRLESASEMLPDLTKSVPKSIPAGTKVYLGSPARPMASDLSTEITKLLGSIRGIVEAHVPQCYAAGVIDVPAQILIVVVTPGIADFLVASEISQGLTKILPTGVHMDFMLMGETTPELKAVRRANCRIV